MQQVQLSIPEPCHEDWQQMTPTEQGRFCNACAKQVVDFSTMSDTQVLNYFSNIKNEKVCGRAYPDQLERAITKPKEPKKRLFWYWNYVTMLFLFFSKTNTAKAQIGKVVTTTLKIDTVKKIDINSALQGRVGGVVINNTNIIKGKITDNRGDAIYGVTVMIKGAKAGTTSDAAGFYTIRVHDKKDVLVASAVGFVTKEIKLNGLNTADVVLTKMETLMQGDVVVIGGMSSSDESYSPAENPKHVVVFEVLDNATLKPVNKASMIIARTGDYKLNSISTDKNGIYKLKRIKEYETYNIKITAEGYLTQEIEINGGKFNERKMMQKIFLEKAPLAGDYKKLDGIVIQSYTTTRKTCTTGAVSIKGEMLSTVIVNERTVLDSFQLMRTKIAGTIKINPNPVQKGTAFNLTLKLKQSGTYTIQIINAGGQMLSQKQFVTTGKLYAEQLPTSSAWSSGMYYIRVFDSNNKMISTNNFLIQ